MRCHAKHQKNSSRNLPVTSFQSFAIFEFFRKLQSRRKQNFDRSYYEPLLLGFSATENAKIHLKMNFIPKHEKSGSIANVF